MGDTGHIFLPLCNGSLLVYSKTHTLLSSVDLGSNKRLSAVSVSYSGRSVYVVDDNKPYMLSECSVKTGRMASELHAAPDSLLISLAVDFTNGTICTLNIDMSTVYHCDVNGSL